MFTYISICYHIVNRKTNCHAISQPQDLIFLLSFRAYLVSSGDAAPKEPAGDNQETQPLQDITSANTPPDVSTEPTVLSPEVSAESKRANFQRCRGKTKPELAGCPEVPKAAQAIASAPASKTEESDEAWKQLGVNLMFDHTVFYQNMQKHIEYIYRSQYISITIFFVVGCFSMFTNFN